MKIKNVGWWVLLGLLCVCIVAMAGCQKTDDAIKRADKAIQEAKAADAEKCAPEEYQSAEQFLAQAKKENKNWKFQDAEKSANTSEAQAKLALDKCRTGKGTGLPSGTGVTNPRDIWGQNTAEIEKMSPLENIYFDFDKSNLRQDALATMSKNGAYLKANSMTKVVIEGHCDERGTDEYNIALGQRRAESAKQYLINYGIDPSRLSTISYGESKPLDPGHGEAAWAKNRRCHFSVPGQ